MGIHRWGGGGGIGLVCIKLKLRAFLIMHIVRLLTYSDEYICYLMGWIALSGVLSRFCIQHEVTQYGIYSLLL